MAEKEPTTVGPAQHVVAVLQGYMGSAALKTGLELEVFTHIAHGNDTADKLAAAKKVPMRAMRILCDALSAFGVLAKADGRYSLPPASAELLVKGSPGYIGTMARIMVNPIMWNEAARLTEVVRAGHSLLDHGAEEKDNPFWHDFSLASRQMASMLGPMLADIAASVCAAREPGKILDVACGSGMYGFSALKRFASARLASADWPGVLELVRPTAEKLGLSERVEFRPGDIFTSDLGSGYDLILAANIFHHFSLEQCAKLSRRLYAATAPGGLLMIVDTVADEAREKEQFALAFALTMLIWTKEGDIYTFSEYENMLRAAGYREIELQSVPGPVSRHVIIARKPGRSVSRRRSARRK